MKVKVEVSNRHVHLTKELLSILFGKNFKLSVRNNLSQLGEFASNSTVSIKTHKAVIENVRIVGPLRDYTQVEISKNDAKYLGIRPPKRNSGDLKLSPGITIIGPKKEVFIDECVIIANRHIHLNSKEAKKNHFKNNEIVKAIIGNKEMDNIYVKIAENYTSAIHIDKDDAEKFKIIKPTFANVIKRNVILNMIVLIIEIFILLIVFDFYCYKFYNTTPMIPQKIIQGDNIIYQGFGYKVFNCKEKDGKRKFYIKKYNTDFKCKNDFKISNKPHNMCDGALFYIYEDNNYKYYLPCLKSIYVLFKNGTELKIDKAVQAGKISINELEGVGLNFVKEIK